MPINYTIEYPKLQRKNQELEAEIEKLEARIDRACGELERLRDEPEPEIYIPPGLPEIDNILFDLEGGEESFVLILEGVGDE